MTYLVAINGKVQKINNVAEVKTTFFDYIFTMTDGTTQTFAKNDMDILGRA